MDRNSLYISFRFNEVSFSIPNKWKLEWMVDKLSDKWNISTANKQKYFVLYHNNIEQAYSEPNPVSKMEPFAKMVNGF